MSRHSCAEHSEVGRLLAQHHVPTDPDIKPEVVEPDAAAKVLGDDEVPDDLAVEGMRLDRRILFGEAHQVVVVLDD